MRSDPQKYRDWQERSRRKQLQKRIQAAKDRGSTSHHQAGARNEPQRSQWRSRRRRNDSEWRNECLEQYGSWCRVCGNSAVEMDHIMPRGQGGPSVVENGLPLCNAHHTDKTRGRLKIRPEWLDDQQIAWLEEVGWVWWNSEGQPQGRGWKHFKDKRPLERRWKDDHDK